jgi:spore coat polysaccharide biosynthesis predicted glycosyltransferase SpsG
LQVLAKHQRCKNYPLLMQQCIYYVTVAADVMYEAALLKVAMYIVQARRRGVLHYKS